jgi:hypothetical protein
MPAVFRMLLFALAPMTGAQRGSFARNLTVAVSALVTEFSKISSGEELQAGGQIPSPSMAALRQATDFMQGDAVTHGLKQGKLCTIYVGLPHFVTIQNILTLEYHARFAGGGVRYPTGILFPVDEGRRYPAAVPVDWERNAVGKTDLENITLLVTLGARNLTTCSFLTIQLPRCWSGNGHTSS